MARFIKTANSSKPMIKMSSREWLQVGLDKGLFYTEGDGVIKVAQGTVYDPSIVAQLPSFDDWLQSDSGRRAQAKINPQDPEAALKLRERWNKFREGRMQQLGAVRFQGDSAISAIQAIPADQRQNFKFDVIAARTPGGERSLLKVTDPTGNSQMIQLYNQDKNLLEKMVGKGNLKVTDPASAGMDNAQFAAAFKSAVPYKGGAAAGLVGGGGTSGGGGASGGGGTAPVPPNPAPVPPNPAPVPPNPAPVPPNPAPVQPNPAPVPPALTGRQMLGRGAAALGGGLAGYYGADALFDAARGNNQMKDYRPQDFQRGIASLQMVFQPIAGISKVLDKEMRNTMATIADLQRQIQQTQPTSRGPAMKKQDQIAEALRNRYAPGASAPQSPDYLPK